MTKTGEKVVSQLMQAYPFEHAWAKAWVSAPQNCPVSAQAIQELAEALEEWVG